MAKQEPMTQEPASTQEHDEVGAGPPAGPARGAAGWFGGLSRGRKLALTWSASVLAVVVALLAIGATSGGAAPRRAPPPRASAFTLSALGHPGQHISLAQYAGHPLILNFFASWCAPCQRETPLIARFHRSHRSVIIVGIDVNDSSSAGLAFARKMGVAYPVASDPAPMTMALSYGVTALPQTFFLNAQHRIVRRLIRAVTLTDLRNGVAIMTKPSMTEPIMTKQSAGS